MHKIIVLSCKSFLNVKLNASPALRVHLLFEVTFSIEFLMSQTWQLISLGLIARNVAFLISFKNQSMFVGKLWNEQIHGHSGLCETFYKIALVT
jgi:hypothetical protein